MYSIMEIYCNAKFNFFIKESIDHGASSIIYKIKKKQSSDDFEFICT